MIPSNNYKLKSSKSNRDEVETEGANSDESFDPEKNEKHGPSRNKAKFGQRSVMPGRGGFRGRKAEQNLRSRKFEGSRSDSLGARKFYEQDVKLNLPEDTRISKLLRRLSTESSQEVSLQISRKLLEVLLYPDNAAYIRKAFHILGESMYEILHVSPGPLAKSQAARALGRMGYIMGQEGDFNRYHTWLFSKIGTSYEELQILLMSTFKETLRMEMEKTVLTDYIDGLVNSLVGAIEVTENVEVFKAILEVLVKVIDIYPDGFHSQFCDTIDLLFGWHVDHTQTLENIEFISDCMQKLSSHFKYHFDFSISLIENFMEDISNYTSDLPDSVEHVIVLVLALNTVLKCLGPSFRTNSISVDFILDCLNCVIRTATKLDLSEDLLIASNECITLLLTHLDTKSLTLSQSIYQLLELQLSAIDNVKDNTVVSMLAFAAKIVKELSANLPIEVIDMLIGPQSALIKLRNSPYSDIKNAVICVYQALLNLKNVGLLQEAYKFVLGDLERSYSKLVPTYRDVTITHNPFEGLEDEGEDPAQAVLFLFRCLTQLSNASSIIVMWALKPSILELVGLQMRPDDPSLALTAPYLQFGMLYLLYAHCKCYNHFISNSTLVTTQKNRFALSDSDSSPNSGNFQIILDVLYSCLNCDSSVEVTLMLLNWLRDILVYSDSCLEVFYSSFQFTKLVEVLVRCGYSFNARIVESVGGNLRILLGNRHLAWSHQFLFSVKELCQLQLTSTNPKLRDQYSQLLCFIPWDITVMDRCKPNKIGVFNRELVNLGLNWLLSGSLDSDMYPEQFKTVMQVFLHESDVNYEALCEVFTVCWNGGSTQFFDLTLNSIEVLTNWCTLEAARFCVNSKLRTPLGKPNETFTKIETALNELGNDLLINKGGNKNRCVARVRLLLQFVEHLEKCIYNASEGCATIAPPTKSVKSFFIANTNTCLEWWSRIRMVVAHVALHCGESALALRHAQNLLKLNSQDVERVVVFMTCALVKLKEPEALHGLYVWCKHQSKHYPWIKYGADQAARKFESALEGYQRLHKEKLSTELQLFVEDRINECSIELSGGLLEMPEDDNCYELKQLTNWNVFDSFDNTATNLRKLSLNGLDDSKLQDAVTVIREQIQELQLCGPSELLRSYSILHYVAVALIDRTQAPSVFLVSEDFENGIRKIDSSVLGTVLKWSEYFAQTNASFKVCASNLRLEVAKRARKERNFSLASKHLVTCFHDHNINISQICDVDQLEFPEHTTRELARAFTEVVKLMYCNQDSKHLALELASVWAPQILKGDNAEIASKLLLKVAGWLPSCDRSALTNELTEGLPPLNLGACSVIPETDLLVGRLVWFSANHCPGLAKSWYQFGNWCYRWGKKVIEHQSSQNCLSEEICQEVQAWLPPDTPQQVFQQVLEVITLKPAGFDDLDSSDVNSTETIQTKLQTILPQVNQLNGLVEIWKKSHKNIYKLYSLSADSYFKYLNLTSTQELKECTTVTVTLRLLRLIVKYALELQGILDEGLQTTPTGPWKVIIPQLFSRLNHPESYVRVRVSELLCRVAGDAPQLIIFPAVIGALDEGLKFDLLPGNLEDLDVDSDSEDGVNKKTLQKSFQNLVENLTTNQNKDFITQVQVLVKELRRITLLWEELWLGTLGQLQTEITKRQQQLEIELAKVQNNPHLTITQKTNLITEKHRIITKPLIVLLEQLELVTSPPSETPHEANFQLNYSKDIQTVIAGLKDPDDPLKSLKPLKLLYKKFQQKFQKKTLQTKDISPILHSFQNTLIAMPGLDSKLKVSISKVGDLVQVLPTKTRPKKLVFYGSDGQTYTYLFKGSEDLHLDERIMQFLSIANTMMAQNADPAGRNLYRARHYSVIPLGPRSGLISWVDGTTPVFALYKRWQQRELAKPGNTKSLGTVPRPSELFYNKLMEHGVKNMENRKEWPLTVLKDVLTELMAETPADLIAKELWCNAISANQWWQVVKRYSYSVAVMSIIGYIIGLGDRHLDNVLIDLQTGDVVHIDYNVCFEKGKTLRVPEKVPFRLTPNIREALGVTGVEGIFRLACENVLKTMRKGRETLLTLLEAFVYDPLIDWTVGGEVLAGTTFGAINPGDQNKLQTKKELECEVTLAMFDVRCTEMEVEWSENKEEILNEIPGLVEQLNLCMELSSTIEEIEDQLQDLHQQLALVKEAEAQGPKKHSLYKLPMLYDAYVKSQEAVNNAKKGLCDILKDCEQHLNVYNQLKNSFESQQFVQWLNELKFNLIEEKMFDLVRDFLHKAGKDDLVSECDQSEVDIAVLAQNLNLNTTKCIQTFQDYFSLLVQCPKSYLETHRVVLYTKWANYLLDTQSVEGCDLVLEEFKNFLDSTTQNGEEIVKTACALDNHYKDTLIQVNRYYELAIKSRDDAVSLETTYNQAKKNLKGFLGQEANAQKALKFVLAGELLLLNRMLLTSEITAQKSGNWLIKLTSREGDWFLDDLVLYSFRAVEIVNNIPLKSDDDPRLFQLIEGIRTANAVYKGLYDLNFNFHTIILPETMKKVQSDEDSVRAIITELDRVIGESEMQISDILAGLEKLLTCVLMHVDVHTSYDYLLNKVATVKGNFLELITSSQSDSGLSQGKMLLMGFNGLFEKINQEINNLVTSLGCLDLPKSWKKLDHVKEAKNIAPHIFNHQIKTILENIFFLKKILAISEFFAASKQMCQGVRCNVPTLIYSDEALTKPIKQFTAEFVSRFLLGVTPEIVTYVICMLLQQLSLDVTHEIEQKDIGAESKVPLDELYQKGYSLLLKDGAFSASLVSQASGLETSMKLAWEKIQEPKKVEQKLAILQSSAFRLQTQLAVHSLMFDDVLALSHVPTARVKFVQEMRAELVSLQSTFKQVKEAQEKQQKLIDKAYQRLNWAKGVNPNVGEILTAFETAVRARDTQLNLEQKIAGSILHSYNLMLQHELLRMSGSDVTKNYDQLFLKCYDQWRRACQFDETKPDNLQPAEQSILGMLSLELIQNPKWLHQVALHITDVIGLYQKRSTEKKEDLFVTKDRLTSLVNNFKAVYAVHTRLMEDVKGLVKAMTKMEDCGLAAQEFARKYREYGEHFVGLFGGFKDRCLDKALIEEMLAHLRYIENATVTLYEGLLSLQGGLRCSETRPQRKNSLKDRTENKVQLRNAYALNVWRRVKMKLEGRDPDPGSKSTVPEQVDYVIREATSLDNLALLYEGWTPWV